MSYKKTDTSLSVIFTGIGKVIVYSDNVILLPESDLVFVDKKTGKFKVKKFKDLKKKELLDLLSRKKSKTKSSFMGVKK